MAATIPNALRAIAVSVFVVHAFVHLNSLTHNDLAIRHDAFSRHQTGDKSNP